MNLKEITEHVKRDPELASKLLKDKDLTYDSKLMLLKHTGRKKPHQDIIFEIED